MIRVARTLPVPPTLRSGRASAERGRATRFFRRRVSQRAQEAYSFDAEVYAAEDVGQALSELFQGKCAYCETRTTALTISHFRPIGGALALDGKFSPDHYWWLAYEWENLYPSCQECDRLKGQRFPVAARRARPRARGALLTAERPLLLDPCGDEDPELHLVYLDDGQIASETEVGRTTIDVLGLNRSSLVTERLLAIDRLKSEWKRLVVQLAKPKQSVGAKAFEQAFGSEHEFAGLRRQLLNQWAHTRPRQVDQLLAEAPTGPSSLAEVVGEAEVITKSTQQRVQKGYLAQQREQDAYSLAAKETAEGYFARTRWVEKVEIRNFKAIERLTLELPAGTEDRAPWIALLGENGSGKSTVLRAIALTLLDAERREELRQRHNVDARDYVRHGRRQGSVAVHLSGSPEPVRLSLSHASESFGGSADLKQVVLGYGAIRLLPKPTASPSMALENQPLVRVENLFDPFVPLGDATAWLLSLRDRDFETDVAVALKDLLALERRERLIRNRRRSRVEVEQHGTRSSLEELSDGYQSLVALAADIMAVVKQSWPVVRAAEGIVLIDELGSHLHPRWRMRIVGALRSLFPRIQFVVSTHDPLCLRGLGAGEVAVMRRTAENRIVALTEDLPPPDSLRVEQLLASEYFGLGSTVDPELDRLFAEYYLLKAKPRLSLEKEERTRLGELAVELEGRDRPWVTRRERLVYEAADEYVARELDLTDAEERRELRDETKRKIAEIWTEPGA